MPTVNMTVVTSAGAAFVDASVEIWLLSSAVLVNRVTKTPIWTGETDGSGEISLSLTGGLYRLIVEGTDKLTFRVPLSGGPYNVTNLIETTE